MSASQPPLVPPTLVSTAVRPLAARLKQWLRGVPGYPILSFLYHFTSSGTFRNNELLRLRRPENLFQYRSVTTTNRYPRIFGFIQQQLAEQPAARMLSFGCSTGEEVFTLRDYFPTAFIKGIDINPRSIATCEARLRRTGDPRLAFAIGNSTAQEDTGAYDAVFCMAVLRRSELAASGVDRCDHLIRFADFERQVTDFARCLKDGGFFAIRHTNFRFADTHIAANFEPVLQIVRNPPDKTTPLFDRSNCRLVDAVYHDVVFRKRFGSCG